MSKKPLSPETIEKMRIAQRKRMAEGRHNFHKGHKLFGPGIGETMKGKPSPKKGVKLSDESIQKIKDAYRNMSSEIKAERAQRLREANLGKKQSPELIAKRFASRKGYRHSLETRQKMSESLKARFPADYVYLTPINKRIKKSVEFRRWREKVFARDDYTCQICSERGGELHPDHIKPFAYYPELRFELSNGRTLCKNCHMKTDTWGAKATRSRKVN